MKKKLIYSGILGLLATGLGIMLMQPIQWLKAEEPVTEASLNLMTSPSATGYRANTEEMYIPATQEEIQARNKVANERSNFNPDVKVEKVKNWDQFLAAYNDSSVTKIKLIQDIRQGPKKNTNRRTTSIEIEGNKFDNPALIPTNAAAQDKYYTLDIGNNTLGYWKPVGGAKPLFHIHDLILKNQGENAAGEQGAVITPRVYDEIGGNRVSGSWYFRFGNIEIPNEQSVAGGTKTSRLARLTLGQATFYGELNLQTQAENLYVGDVVMEDGTKYEGSIIAMNYSMFWYKGPKNAGETGEPARFQVGKHSLVNLRMAPQNGGTIYPVIFRNYKAISIGENTVYNASMGGTTVSFIGDGQSFTVKKGAKVNLTSRGNFASIVATGGPTVGDGIAPNTQASNATFKVEEGGELYLIGQVDYQLINFASTRKGNKFILDKPKYYDIRNFKTTGALQRAFLGSAGNELIINDSDIDLWKKASNPLGPSDFTYNKVQTFSTDGRNAAGIVATSSIQDLANQYKSNQGAFRRISGMNQQPTVTWEKRLTDADKQLTNYLRVKIGDVPDNQGLQPDGSITYLPVWAAPGQVQLKITNDHDSNIVTTTTKAQGYADFTLPDFYPAGTKFYVEAQRGSYISDPIAPNIVVDVTPPEPAKLTSSGVSPVSEKLKGTGLANSHVTISINNKSYTDMTARVDTSGNWEMPIPTGRIAENDVIQIFLRDNAGLATGVDTPPSTNNAIGNINPKNDTPYHNAIFKAGTKVTVKGVLELRTVPDEVDFGTADVLKANTMVGVDKTKMGTGLVVSDTRGTRTAWAITAEVETEMTSQTAGDVLPNALKYVYQGTTYPLTAAPKVVYKHVANDSSLDYSISDSWGMATTQDGLKFQYSGNKIPVANDAYRGKVKWTLRDTIE